MLPIFGIPALVTALATQQPVHLASCELSAPVRDLHMGTDIGTTIDGGYTLHVRFSDSAAEPLTRVVFELSDGSRIVDAGRFAPGVTIDHLFNLPPNTATSCSVGSATFADGTQWAADPASIT
jgi:hypothetical protein